MSNVVELKTVTSKIGSGATPTGGESAYKNHGVALIRSQNVLDFNFSKKGLAYIDDDQAKKLQNVEVLKGDILLNITGDSIARCCVVPEKILPARVNQHVSIIRSNGEIDSKYLFYYLENLKSYLLKICGVGGTRNALTKEALEKLPVRLNDNDKQIASVLSALDDKIEVNNKINTELEAMAKTLYDYWFVQFDFPNEEGKPYKTLGGRMEYNELLKREIPVGWEVKALSKVTEFLGRGVSPKYTETEGIPVLNQKCIRNKSINFFLSRQHDNKAKPVSTKLVKVGDVLVNSTGVGTLGRTAFVKRLEHPITTCDSHVTIVRPDSTLNNSFFISYSLTDKQEEIEKLGEGSTGQTELSREELGKISMTTPSRKLQDLFETKVKIMFAQIANNEIQNQELANLRDWLLPMLMNGQVSVGNTHMTRDLETAYIQIAAEPVVEYGRIIKLAIPDKSKGFAKQVLGGKIVSLFRDDPNFTHIKFQKLQYLAEHIAEADLDLNYYFQTAGPHDGRFMHTIADKLKNSKWFEERNYKFYPLEKQDKIDGYYQGYFAPAQDRLDKLFHLLANATEAEAEIFATLYAVWNNRIILKQPISETNIIEDFYRWSDRKLQYSKDQLLKSLEILRNNQMVPTGFGKEIKTAKNKSK